MKRLKAARHPNTLWTEGSNLLGVGLDASLGDNES
jgi:hypothetical protein